MGLMVIDTTNNTKGLHRDLNGNKTSELLKMQQCVGKNADEKILCKQGVQNDKTINLNNENSRLNQTRDRKMKY